MKFYTQYPARYCSRLSKILLVMRLIFLILLSGLMQVHAKTYGQQFSLKNQSISIKEVFKAVKVQTGYDILWQPGKLDASRKINANFNKSSLSEVIQACLTNSLTFTIEDKSIVIKPVKEEKGLINNSYIVQDSLVYKGTVNDEKGKPLPGATVKIVGGTKTTFTNSSGDFLIYATAKSSIRISYLGYLSKEISLAGLNAGQAIKTSMIPGTNNLGEVNIVSTGYQDLAKERATGSFEVITKEQLQHSSDPNLLRRLEGITTSMNFNNNLTPTNSSVLGQSRKSPLTNLTIRGKNTLDPNNIQNSSGQVLVVIDGIASPYSIDLVNPNDVESITVLKDAAAASIWGSRAANGVIVIKTKKGSYEQPLRISFNTNVNVTEKMNLFYKKYMSTSEFIDAQIFQYDASKTSLGVPSSINLPQRLASPVAEILDLQKQGKIDAAETNRQLDALRGNDIRKDYDKYLLRDAVTQSYSLGLDGGSKRMAYRISGAYDNILNNTKYSSAERIVLNFNTSFRPLKNLELQANLSYNEQRNQDQAGENSLTASFGNGYYPYTRLADDNGNPLAVPFVYRPAYLDLLTSTYGSSLLDLRFKPLEDVKEGYNRNISRSLNFNLGAIYKISNILSVNATYNDNRGRNDNEILYKQNSFYMRNLINTFTDPSTLTKQVPLGGMFLPLLSTTSNQTLRGQLNANKNWGEKHSLNAIAGIDVNQTYSYSRGEQYLGYNDKALTSVDRIDYVNYLNIMFIDPDIGIGADQIPVRASGISDQKIRTYSLYANAAYSYLGRYIFSGSVRKDASSEFGVGTNKGGTPFYSMGASWNIAKEPFYQLNWLPRLQLRSTFGYNGNVNSKISARPVILHQLFLAPNGLPFAVTGSDPSNSQLRPEKTSITNFGLDFGIRNNRISGSIEYYNKRTTDLIADNTIDPTTGFNRPTFNIASLHGWGTDITLNSINFQNNVFSWTSSFLFSSNRVKVSKLFSASANTALDVVVGGISYSEGYDLSRMFAFRWAGLDPNTGEPRGFVNGQPITISATSSGSDAWNSILAAPISSTKYFGSLVPVYFGSLRNSFNYSGFMVSVNLLYKFGYYFRRPSSEIVQYGQLFNSNRLQGAEYSRRWQKPGDELSTNVPSLKYPASGIKDNFYYYSDINVLKADHIRLQEINLSYTFKNHNWFIKNPRIYTNISNLGVIWRANKYGLDPDINDYPNPRTYALGLSANF
ncbi:SusC/RagA family TonB-linked outer membrane protein [Pedobacter hartonius]|uniref:TonB-linked outer membrane protein, SusC/RagA family n=1 Tax=Pedobacter hartonius TaxID=425514 RepID=A0A1H4HIH5_9SPHI|nr:SusC/RagA family TonB-linked outer membrane protein [Pedobacter hartonius]SEB21659.1 TonB-linked outer membrane protein, SusC/RagA family [Pedobacter hartonius]